MFKYNAMTFSRCPAPATVNTPASRKIRQAIGPTPLLFMSASTIARLDTIPEIDVLPRPQGRGFLLQDGDVPPRGCSLRHSRFGHVPFRIRCKSTLSFQDLRYLYGHCANRTQNRFVLKTLR